MKFNIIGSGGCVSLPKPLCGCPVCIEARAKGFPYARCGCSLYLEDARLLVDTPEDIGAALNHAGIRAVDAVLYTHWDPDHTLGIRIFEQLRLEWLDYFEGKKPESPVAVYADSEVMDDLIAIRNKHGSFLAYYQHMGLVTPQVLDRPLMLGDIKITSVRVPEGQAVSVFVFEQSGSKLVYAPCDCKPFPDDPAVMDADVLILGNTFVGDVLKDGRIIGDDHLLRKELHSFEDALAIKNATKAKRMIITHLEEDWGKGYDDYLALEAHYPGVRFAFDGMKIEV